MIAAAAERLRKREEKETIVMISGGSGKLIGLGAPLYICTFFRQEKIHISP